MGGQDVKLLDNVPTDHLSIIRKIGNRHLSPQGVSGGHGPLLPIKVSASSLCVPQEFINGLNDFFPQFLQGINVNIYGPDFLR